MTTARSPQTIIRRLKKEVVTLHRKEAEVKNQLINVFSELKNLGKAYEKKAAASLKKMKTKLKASKASPFIKAIGDAEKQILQKMAPQKNLLANIVSHVEKKMKGKLAKVSTKKTKRKVRR